MAVSKAGEIQAFDIDVLSGAGAYSQYPRTSVFEANQILNITGGPYRHKHYRARATVVYLRTSRRPRSIAPSATRSATRSASTWSTWRRERWGSIPSRSAAAT